MNLKCRVIARKYHNEENDFAVLLCSTVPDDEQVTLCGTFFPVRHGDILNCEGAWGEHRQHGRHFAVESYSIMLPVTTQGMESYLATFHKGLGRKTAALIVKTFGKETFAVLDEHPERLTEIKGIGKKRLQAFLEAWKKQREWRSLMAFMQSYGISSTLAVKIHRRYGNDSARLVMENPYSIADEISGVGFATADKIALAMGYAANDRRRCAAALLHLLEQGTRSGNVYLPQEEVVADACRLVGASREDVEGALAALAKVEEVTVHTEPGGARCVYLRALREAEDSVVEDLSRLLAADGEEEPAPPVQPQIDGIELDPVQREAVAKAAANRLLVLTGGPGTGKTTTVRGILAHFRNEGCSIALAAPTGRAAKRLAETTGEEASTIHRLLDYSPATGWGRHAGRRLECDVLIVDECSMIDLPLMRRLLDALPDDIRLVLVGDVDQLPSVGPGNVLHDIISSGLIATVRLQKVFRQALTSRIVSSAHRVNRGEMPDLSNGADSDFFFVREEDDLKAADLIVDLVKRRLPAAYGIAPNDIQVLTPQRRGVLGTEALNERLQSSLNACVGGLARGTFSFYRGDRVMQTANNYEKEVFNGDTGLIERVDARERKIKVRYGTRSVEYLSDELEQLTQAYAMTIHKAQGSEYRVVVVPVTLSHRAMLRRNLYYTAITRARELCVMVGTERALHTAVTNRSLAPRYSLLAQRLRRVREQESR